MGKEEIDTKGKVLDINTIQKIVPHRYPFLLVDRIIEVTETKAIGIKNVSINEPFFQGHFPGHPIMPGVLILETMAQVGGIGALNRKENLGKLAYFASISSARFRKPVIPGDVLRIEVDIVKIKMGVLLARSVAKVGDDVVAEAEFSFVFIKPEDA